MSTYQDDGDYEDNESVVDSSGHHSRPPLVIVQTTHNPAVLKPILTLVIAGLHYPCSLAEDETLAA